MMIGRATDRWINLFEQEDQLPEQKQTNTIDDLFEHVEQEVKAKLDPNTPPEQSSWASSISAFANSRQSK